MGKYKVTFIFDRTYVWKMLTVVNSIIQNEKKEYADSIDFYLTYFGIEKEGEFILKHARKNFPNNGFYLKHVPTELPDLYKKYESSYDYESSANHIQTSSVLARFDLDKIWPEVTDRLLYLDLDLIVKGSISELFSLADKNSIISACKSGEKLFTELASWRRGYDDAAQIKYYNYSAEFRDNLESIYNDYWNRKSLDADVFDYFFNKEYDLTSPALNAGVFILNIEKYKKDKALRRRIEFLIKLNSGGEFLRYNDQSILNFAFYGQVDWIDQEWNRLDYGWENKNRVEEIKEQFEDAKIIHYNGWSKPWALLYHHPDLVGIEEYFLPGVKLWAKYHIK